MFRLRTLLGLLIAGLVTVIAVAACGGSRGTGGSATAARTAALKFASCMRANGVPNFPDPGHGSGGGVQLQATQSPNGQQTLKVNGVPVNAPAFQSAQTKCQKYVPQGPALTSSDVARIKARALKMAACMRTHGVPNFPDPTVSTGPGGHGISIGLKSSVADPVHLNPQSPAFEAAQKICGGAQKLGLARASG